MNQFSKLLIGFCIASAATVSAQSIASTLAEYQKTSETEVTGISVSSFSGVTFHPTSRTLYVIDDETAEIFEITIEGSLIRTITLDGFEDMEGIAFQTGNYFFVVEERKANLLRILLPPTGSGTVYWDSSTVLSLGEDWGNSGLEDVAYNSLTGVVYAVKEFMPPRLYTITLNTDGDPVSFTPNEPFNIEFNSGDAAGLYAPADSSYLLLSQEDNKILGYSGVGTLLSELPLGMTKPEGVTVDESDNTIYVVGEPRELYVFKNPNNSIQLSDNSKNSFDFTCNLQAGNDKMLDIRYTLHFSLPVRLEIMTAQGRLIKTVVSETNAAGRYRHRIDTGGFPAGLCLFVFQAGPFFAVKKQVLL